MPEQCVAAFYAPLPLKCLHYHGTLVACGDESGSVQARPRSFFSGKGAFFPLGRLRTCSQAWRAPRRFSKSRGCTKR